MTTRYIITAAVESTPVHRQFFDCLRTYCRTRRAELIVVPVAYHNPTSRFDKQFEEGEYATDVEPYLCHDRRQLAPNLTLFADVRIQPTASRPLTGFEVFVAHQSAILGHPLRALEVIPTAKKFPRLLMTTSACTVPNYSNTRAGKRGEAHHVLGALVVDVDAKGIYFPRHVSYDSRTKSFTDLNRRYYADRAEAAPPSESLTFGDIHVRQPSADGKAERGAKALFDLVKPKHLVLHDVFDGESCNPHEEGTSAQIRRLDCTVRDEVIDTCEALIDFSNWGDGAHLTHVVHSNHDCFLDRWLEAGEAKAGEQNLGFYHWLKHSQIGTGYELPALANFFRLRWPAERVHFLGVDEELTLKGVAHPYHGHKGPNGAKGSAMGFRKLGSKVTIAHTHQPKIIDAVVQVGVYANLRPGFTKGSPSGWLNAHCPLHADGKRQLIIIIDGRFCA